ncbi:hypothetical protein OG436_28900 [Streptomyces caniferus]|uniref:DUF6603 domain-containing protein n=1 Tax=Streptomyces caniferus TaxID=285557 RepID=UPI002E2C95F9|nr:DUF6603 domain-containing protein [Streptomyces caniferus]
MPVSVEDLKRRFPQPGGEFVLRLDEFPFPELYQLVGNGELLALRTTEVRAEELTVLGTVAVLGGPEVVVTLRFAADAANQYVTGLTARHDAAEGETLDVVAMADAWGLDLTGAPRAFVPGIRRVTAQYDSLALGRVVITAETEHVRIVFAGPRAGDGLVCLVGVKDSDVHLSDLPHIGAEIPGGDEVGVQGVELIAAPGEVTAEQATLINTAVAEAVDGGGTFWPLLPEDRALGAGLWVGAAYVLPGGGPRVWLVRLVPEVSWQDFPAIRLGRFTVSKFGLGWSSGGGSGGGGRLGSLFDVDIDLGWLRIELPDLGFDFALPDVGPVDIVRRLPALSLQLGGGRVLRFDIPRVEMDLPGFPGLPQPRELTGWWRDGSPLTLPDLAALLGLELPELPDIFPTVPSLGLRLDLSSGAIAFSGASDWLRLVFAGLPLGSDRWSKLGLIGFPRLQATLGDLPFLGEFFSDKGIDLSAFGLFGGPDWPTAPQLDLLNGWISDLVGAVEWPRLPGNPLAGLSLGLGWTFPSAPSRLDWSLPWPTGGGGGGGGTSWRDLLPPLRFGDWSIPRVGLDWLPDWVLSLTFDPDFDLGDAHIELTGLGFELDLGERRLRPILPDVVLTVGDSRLVFKLPGDVPGPPWPKRLTAVWQHASGVTAQDLAGALGLALPELPPMLTPKVYEVGLHLDLDDDLLLLAARTERCGWMLASQPVDNTAPKRRRYAMAVRAAVEARASQLPLVGECITLDNDIALTGVQFGYASAAWPQGQVERVNDELDEIAGIIGDGSGSGGDGGEGEARALAVPAAVARPSLPRLLDEPLQPGVLIWALLYVGDEELPPLVLRLDSRPGSALALGTPAPVDGVVLGRERIRSYEDRERSSQDVGRVFGPVRIRKVGLGYRRDVLFVAFDATLSLGPVQLDTVGLGLGLDKDYRLTPVLQSAGLRIDVPPLKVTGALVVRDDEKYAVYITGAIAVETGFFAMEAAGSYARSVDGWSSVFLFGEIAARDGGALFGPPAFTVTGLSGGFGVNSTVRVPEITQLDEFPLVNRLGAGPDGTGPAQMLERLNDWVRPAEGRYWGAIGVQFTSFQFIAARALALVEFGDDLKVMLLGRTSITFPKGAPYTHARLNIDLKLAYVRSQGLLSLDAVVGPGSFVYDPAVQLTGGIAVYIWTAGPHAGDFVITAGGYHPRFRVPDHYPVPARLGFVWAPDSKIMVKAEVYTALTPNAFMVGGRLAATYASGLLSAWFTAYIDILVQWRPFSLEADLGISIGVAFTIKVWFVKVRVSIEVGIDLSLWMPPLGGRATVKVWFISFSFDIGAKRKPLDAAKWPEVREQLPEPLSITPLGGLLADVDPGELAARRAEQAPVLIAAAGFAAAVETVIPATQIYLNDEPYESAGSPDDRISIRPMRERESITSEFRITVRKGTSTHYRDFDIEILRRDAPTALWGTPLDRPDQALDGPDLLPGQLCGLRLAVPEADSAGELGPVTSKALSITPVTPHGHTPLRNGDPQGPAPLIDTVDSIETIAEGIDAATKDNRAAAYGALHRLGLAPGAAGASLRQYADDARDYLVSRPLTTNAR